MRSLVLRASVCMALGILAWSGGPASAVICSSDTVPAATLLLPYFEVDLANLNGTNTLFAVNSATSFAQLARVTIWSDLSVPVFGFNIYLTGFDMQTFDLRALLVNGVIPATASHQQDPADTISPQGPFSQDITFLTCFNTLPPPGPLPQATIDQLQAALTGRPMGPSGQLCAGRRFHDRLARGYVTVDAVIQCSNLHPSDPGYFGPFAVAIDSNGLFGDYTYTEGSLNLPVTDTMVAIEASATDPAVSTPGRYTFYGRYVGWNASDHREPLPTTFGVRYTSKETSFIAWRDSKVVQAPFACGTTPAWFPLGQEQIALFDEQEDTAILGTSSFPFPTEAGRVLVGSGTLPSPFASGWASLDLNAFVPAAGNNPPFDRLAAQAWVRAATVDSNGRFLGGYDAVRYDTACQAQHGAPGIP